jgi:hypothetical protein
LYDFVISIFDFYSDSVSLFEHIRFEYLDSERIDRFILWSFEHLDGICCFFRLWEALSVCLRFNVSPSIWNSRITNLMF